MDQQPSTPPDPIQREQALFAAALERAPEDRATFVDGACHDDPELRQRLETLLAANDDPDSLLPEDLTADATHESPFHDEAVGQTLGRYKLLERVGEGGYGVVYVAEQTEPVRRRVALKVIKLGMDTKQVVARFEAERQALALMDHPNIAKVLDAGTTEQGRPYFVMELVRGIKITDYCDQEKMSTKDRLDLFIKVCHAIQHAHQKGIIHRDIKPSNILVTLHDGVPIPKVIDFGIAKATEGRLTDATVYTQLHQFIGTPAYMSPEQAEMSGLDIDTRSDIYSLGVLLYELLTGKTPFDGKELVSMGIDAMRKTIREQEPERPSTWLATLQGEDLTATAKQRSVETSKLAQQLKGDLDWIVMKCLEKDRNRRYDTANGVAADIKRYLANEPVVARPPSPFYRLQKMLRRNKVASLATVGIVTALALGVGLAMAALLREREANRREIMANQRELDQSVRADTVTTFINTLLDESLPLMLKQGNTRGARELVNTADRLAASSFTNAPASEIELRYRLMRLLNSNFNDFEGSLLQAESLRRLLANVADNQLTIPRERIRIHMATALLYTSDGRNSAYDRAMLDLDMMYVEFMERTPPARFWAGLCRRVQGTWFNAIEDDERAANMFAKAYELLSDNKEDYEHEFDRTVLGYADTLAKLENYSLAEQVIKENLNRTDPNDEYARLRYRNLVKALCRTLCRQDRFEDAIHIIEEHRRVLTDKGASEVDLLRIEEIRGHIFARWGKARDALEIFANIASDDLSSADSWDRAAILAIAAGEQETYLDLCRMGVLRFASTTQGKNAGALAHGLLAGPTNETLLSLAHGVVKPMAEAKDWSDDFTLYFKALLSLREASYQEALILLDRFIKQEHTTFVFNTATASPTMRAHFSFIRARLNAELGNEQEAQKDFKKASEFLDQALGDELKQDLGGFWMYIYEAQCWQREAEATFKAKGIPLQKEHSK